MTGQERAVIGIIASVMVLLFVILLWPRDSVAPTKTPRNATTESDKPVERPPVPRQTPPEIPAPPDPPPLASNTQPEPIPEPAESGEPPPVTALILTFPFDMSEAEMDEKIAKCKGIIFRRRGTFVKIKPDKGASYASIKNCFKFSDVQVQEERGTDPSL